MAPTRTNREGNAAGICFRSVGNDAGGDGEDQHLSLVPGSALLCSEPDQEVVQKEATPDGIPAGWTRFKLEPD